MKHNVFMKKMLQKCSVFAILFSVPKSGHVTEVRGFTLPYSFHQNLLYSISQSILVANNPFTSRYLSCHSCTTVIHATSPSNPALTSQPSAQSFSSQEQGECVVGKKGLYQCSIAAVTNYHKLSGLKQHKFIILPFWRSEI